MKKTDIFTLSIFILIFISCSTQDDEIVTDLIETTTTSNLPTSTTTTIIDTTTTTEVTYEGCVPENNENIDFIILQMYKIFKGMDLMLDLKMECQVPKLEKLLRDSKLTSG